MTQAERGGFRAFFDFDDLKTEVVEGNVERVVYTGRNLQIVEYRFPANKRFTAHRHEQNEQMGYLVRGRMGFVVGDEERVLEPGDFYHAQVGQTHNAWTFDEPSVLVDVFAPVRDDILEYSNVWIEDVGRAIDGAVEILDDRATRSIDADARLTRLTEGATWAEGPVYLPGESSVMFSDIPNDRALMWSEANGGEEWRKPNDFSNGNTLDREGRIISCEHGNRRIARTELDGTRHGLVDRHDGKRLNSPNDVVVKSDGTIWFTDPPYGILSDHEGHKAPQEQDGCYVYRFDPESGELTVVSDVLDHPNGLAFSPDESLLYVSDTSAVPKPDGNHHILVFDVVDGRGLRDPRVLMVMEPGLPDGLRVDENGDIWTSAGDGIHLIDADGHDLARIRVPEKTSNCVFGGADGRQLFITASTSLYVIDVKVRGAGVAAAVARGERPA